MEVPPKTKIDILYNSAILLMGISPKEMKSVHQKQLVAMFMSA